MASFDKLIGTAIDVSGSAQTVTITVPAGGVAIGDAIFIGGAWQDSSRAFSIASDPRGNPYRLDRTQKSATTLTNGGLIVGYVSTALLAGDLITVTWTGAGGVGPSMAVTAWCWNGFTALPVLDQSAIADQPFTAAPSATTAATTQAAEIAVVVHATGQNGGDTLTLDGTYTARNGKVASAGAVNTGVIAGDKLLSATGAQTSTGADATGSAAFITALATYKIPAAGGLPVGFESIHKQPRPMAIKRAAFFMQGWQRRQRSGLLVPSYA